MKYITLAIVSVSFFVATFSVIQAITGGLWIWWLSAVVWLFSAVVWWRKFDRWPQ